MKNILFLMLFAFLSAPLHAQEDIPNVFTSKNLVKTWDQTCSLDSDNDESCPESIETDAPNLAVFESKDKKVVILIERIQGEGYEFTIAGEIGKKEKKKTLNHKFHRDTLTKEEQAMFDSPVQNTSYSVLYHNAIHKTEGYGDYMDDICRKERVIDINRTKKALFGYRTKNILRISTNEFQPIIVDCRTLKPKAKKETAETWVTDH